MHLGWLGKRRLLRDGYVQIGGVVPPGQIEAALRAINRSLGEQGLPPDRIREMRARTFCPELISAPEILALYRTAAGLVASAAGRVREPTHAQIALRFPGGEPTTPPVPHIDGMPTADNGIPPGTLHHFTALLGVFLTDVAAAQRGNFLVWPGSHRVLEAQFRRHGAASIVSGLPDLLVAPRPLTARAGDVVLAHYALAHAAAPNLGAQVRYAVFFRLSHLDHDAAGNRVLDNLWLEWEGMPKAHRNLSLKRGGGRYVDGTASRGGGTADRDVPDGG